MICRIEINSGDVNQWHGYSAGDYHHFPSFFPSSIQRAILQILSTACTSWARVTPSFAPVLLPSVSLLSGGGGGIGRKVLPLVHIIFTAAIATTTSTTTTTADHRRHLHHLHVAVELVYTQRWGFCRFDKVVSRTQSSTARPRKFGAPIKELQLAQPRRNPASGLFRDSYHSFSSSLFSSTSSQVRIVFLFFFFSFLCVVLIITNAKMR